MKPPLYLNGKYMRRVRTHNYLGLTIPDRVHWRSGVAETLTLRRRFLSTFCKLCMPSWVIWKCFMPSIYKGVVLSRLLYAISLLLLTSPQSGALETFQRVASSTTPWEYHAMPGTAVLIEPSGSLLQRQVEVEAPIHIERFIVLPLQCFFLKVL